MTLRLISKNYGTAYSRATAVIRKQDGTGPAKIFALPNYTLPSSDGSTLLDTNGVLNVYAEDDSVYRVDLYALGGGLVKTDFNVEAGSGNNGINSVLTPTQVAAGAVTVPSVNSANEFIGANGEILAFVEVTPYVSVTSTMTVFTGPCELAGFDVVSVTAGATVTIYDGTSSSGTLIVPTTTISAVGRTEFNWKRGLKLGCHVVLTGTISLNVLVG